MAELVLFEQRDHIAIITLNRPEIRNSLTGPEMNAALLGAVERIEKDKSVHVAIITGAGTAFSSGGDLRKMKETSERAKTEPWTLVDYYRDGIQRLPNAFDAVEVPLIAAINGPAIGAGCDLACFCDIRIAAASARFAESFVKLGIISGDGGAWFLPRIVGMSKASEMTFTGDMIDANEALACGLVSRVVPDDQLMPAALELAGRIAVNPTWAVRTSKRLMKEGRNLRMEQVLQMSAMAQSLANATPDHHAALEKLTKKP